MKDSVEQTASGEAGWRGTVRVANSFVKGSLHDNADSLRPFRRFSGMAGPALLCWTALALTLAACDTTRYARIEVPKEQMQAYLADKPEPLHKIYRDVLEEGRRNFVLNHMKGGLGAFELGADGVAAQSFEQTLLSIEAVYAENEAAEKARSVWYEEGRKDFKGEPYERAMAYYYRGLLFLKEGDYENARACFKSGQLQDALAENQKYQMDFALLVYLEGWASHLLGDTQLAEAAFEEARKLRPELTPPGPEDNVLVITETGKAPVKVATGKGKAALQIKRGSGFRETTARVETASGHEYAPNLTEDIYWQATTRGGREVDKILKDKVVFKETHKAVGETLTQLGVQGMVISAKHKSDEGLVASGIITAIGLVEQGVAASTQTRADDRYWNNLPDRVHLFTYHMDPASSNSRVTVRFLDPDGRELSDLRQVADIHWNTRGHGFAWARSRPAWAKKRTAHPEDNRENNLKTGESGNTPSGQQGIPSSDGRRPSEPD